MTQKCDDGSDILFGLPFGLQVVCGGLEVFDAKERANRFEKFAHKL